MQTSALALNNDCIDNMDRKQRKRWRGLPSNSHDGDRRKFRAAWRAPTLFELYSNGPLLAEGRYEIGDADLDAEHALNLDGSIRWEAGRVRGEIAAFRNDIRDFIYLSPTVADDRRIVSIPAFAGGRAAYGRRAFRGSGAGTAGDDSWAARFRARDE
jgi:hypothetical protein